MTQIEDEEDFDFQEGLYDNACENWNTTSFDPPVLSEASKYFVVGWGDLLVTSPSSPPFANAPC